jgi:glycosyltransferase involved in cell wall biosynthesis
MHFPQFNVPVLYRRPFIVTIHDVTPLIFPGPKRSSWIRDFAFHTVFKAALKNSQAIIAVSEYSKAQILRYFKVDAKKIAVTYLGIESEFKISKNYAKIEVVKERYGLTKPYLFFVGAWRPHKNIVGLLQAYNILKTANLFDGQLLIGGQEDPRYQDIRKTINSFEKHIQENIITPGFIAEDDLPFLYQGSSAYIIPSFLEGFGLNGLEAMASQTPVICSKTGSLPEIYQDAAVYFNPASTDEMAEKINQTLKDSALIERLISSGQKILEKYDWQKTANDTLSIYQRLLRK